VALAASSSTTSSSTSTSALASSPAPSAAAAAAAALSGSGDPTGHNNAEGGQQQQQQPMKPKQNKATSLRKREVVLSRISLYIVFLFLFCHSLRTIPNVYEMVATYLLQGNEKVQFPRWVMKFANLSHLMITLSCSSNFYIYFVKYGGRKAFQRFSLGGGCSGRGEGGGGGGLDSTFYNSLRIGGHRSRRLFRSNNKLQLRNGTSGAGSSKRNSCSVNGHCQSDLPSVDENNTQNATRNARAAVVCSDDILDVEPRRRESNPFIQTATAAAAATDAIGIEEPTSCSSNMSENGIKVVKVEEVERSPTAAESLIAKLKGRSKNISLFKTAEAGKNNHGRRQSRYKTDF